MVLAEWLRSIDYIVHEATTADEATRLLAHPLITIDLVITDIWLPGMIDGLDLKAYLNRAFPDIPVIVVSVTNRHEVANDPNFFQKAYDIDVLSSRIAKLLTEKNTCDS